MKLRRLIALVAALAVASTVVAGPGAGSVAAQPQYCTFPTAIRIIDRTLDVWYGRLRIEDANGVPVSNADLVELDKPISDDSGLPNEPGFRTRLQNDVPGTLPPANGQLDPEWVLPGTGNDAGSDARQALVAAFTAAGNAAGPGSLGPPVDGTTSKKDYLLASVGTVETTAPLSHPDSATLVGDTDDHFGPNPVKCPGPDGSDLQLSVDNRAVAEVSFHELNATYTLAPRPTGDALCSQLRDYVTGSPKYQASNQKKRLVPDALVYGACEAVAHIRPDTPKSHKRGLVLIFKANVQLLRAGGWLTFEQAATLKAQADSL